VSCAHTTLNNPGVELAILCLNYEVNYVGFFVHSMLSMWLDKVNHHAVVI